MLQNYNLTKLYSLQYCISTLYKAYASAIHFAVVEVGR